MGEDEERGDAREPAESGGLGRMIIESARSRIYLGVHWIFDAFRVKNNKPDFSAGGLDIAKPDDPR